MHLPECSQCQLGTVAGTWEGAVKQNKNLSSLGPPLYDGDKKQTEDVFRVMRAERGVVGRMRELPQWKGGER